ncbi:MAG: type I methionyl aminopeptidase [Malacoplasma sp.]|nr:type I methionyl aminopeptidase [Malacoplasma sp.]MDE5774824.1 type I methionyl aminopeptidase [Malacoplasma sp.]MDE7100129.1 type I methionyl aminopeptidase [Malacoplasma sp.]
MIYIKSDYEIEQIKKACEVWKKVKQVLLENTKPGKSLIELDELAKKVTLENGCTTPFHKYQDFPGYNCISVNDVVIHGVPTNYKLKNLDIVTYDVGVAYNGYICDAAFTVVLGNNKEAEKINEVCFNSLMEGIKQIKPNNHIGDISSAIEDYVNKHGYHVIQDFGGHGCGRKLHEDPIILNYGKKGSGPLIKKNMVLCIEPMIFTNNANYYIDKDKWSVIAENHLLTCHWEHMVLVTENGCEILTE